MLENFVADDAGSVCVLFCDICEFDVIIKELKDSITGLLDEIYRAFDALCKKHGVQKIEVGSADE